MVAADAAAAYADAGYTVVWDGIVGPWFLDRIVQRLGARKIRVQYLVLRPRRDTMLERLQGRDDTTETTDAEALYDQFGDLGELEPHVVSSDAPAEQVIETCKAALADGSLMTSAGSGDGRLSIVGVSCTKAVRWRGHDCGHRRSPSQSLGKSSHQIYARGGPSPLHSPDCSRATQAATPE